MNDTALKAWLENEGFPTVDSLQQTLHGCIANATTPLMHAARLGRIGYIGDLLSRGANPREMNADGNSALWFACFADSAPCVNALIKAGAPLDNQNVNGATALIHAASAGKTEIVRAASGCRRRHHAGNPRRFHRARSGGQPRLHGDAAGQAQATAGSMTGAPAPADNIMSLPAEVPALLQCGMAPYRSDPC